MKRLFGIIFALLIAVPVYPWVVGGTIGTGGGGGGTPMVFVNANSASDAPVTVNSTAAGNAILVGVFWKGDVTITSITDAQGSSFTDSGLGRLARPTDGYIQILGCKSIVGSGNRTMTVNFSSAPSEYTVYAAEYSGQNTTTLFGNGNSGTATGGTTATVTSFTPATSNGLVFVFGAGSGTTGGTLSISDGVAYSVRATLAGFPFLQGIGDRIYTSSTGAISPVVTFGTGTLTKAIAAAVEVKAAP